MKAIFFILGNKEKLNPLLTELKESGVTGGTIIPSKGMASEMANSDFALFGTLRQLLSLEHKETTTLLFIANEDNEQKILDAIDKIVGPLTKPDTGVVFAVPLEYAKGIKF